MDRYTKLHGVESSGAEPREDSGLWARHTAVALGAWLLLSAFLLLHAGAARANTALSGLLIAFTSLWALRAPVLRRADTLLAIWLFFSTLLLHRSPSAPVWNNILSAIVTFVLSLVPNRPARLHLRT
jgi:hypothetical protein